MQAHSKILYFIYFASLGTYLPYWPLYLKSAGFSVEQTAQLMSLELTTKIFSPYIWGWIADRSGKHTLTVRIGTLLALCCFVFVGLAREFMHLAVAMMVFGFFWNACLPQFEAITLTSLRKPKYNYSKIRAWGTIGFFCTSLGFAPIVWWIGAQIVPWLFAACLSLLPVATFLFIKKPAYATPSSTIGLLHTIGWKILCLFAICFLVQLSHGPYYAYYSLYMQQTGFPSYAIGVLWSTSVVFEIILLLKFSQYFTVLRSETALYLVIATCVLRWLLTAFFPQVTWVAIAAQIMHSVTYGIYHITLTVLIIKSFPENMSGRAQALYSSVGFGAGGALGAYLSSVLLNFVSGSTLFLLSAFAASIGMIFAYFYSLANHRNSRKDCSAKRLSTKQGRI